MKCNDCTKQFPNLLKNSRYKEAYFVVQSESKIQKEILKIFSDEQKAVYSSNDGALQIFKIKNTNSN